MHRFRTPELFLGCFLTVAVFATGMLFVNRQQPAPTAQSVKQQETPGQGHKTENPDAELTGSTWLTKDAGGFFTFGLVAVGIGQAILFFIQLRYMRVGMRDATIAAYSARDGAIAAKTQAVAIVQAERPYVFFKITKPGLSFSQYEKIIPDIGTKGRLRFDLVNAGKTPAMLEEFKEIYRVMEGMTDTPAPLDPMKDRGRLLPVGTISTANSPYSRATNLFAGNAPEIRKMLEPEAWKDRRIFCQGFVRYSDAFGNRYITGFLAAFSPRHRDWALRGGKKYNYSRQEKREDIPPHPDYPGED